MKVLGIIVMVGIIMCVFSVSSAQPTQIQAKLSENETHVFVEIINLDQKSVDGHAVLNLDELSKIQSFSVPPKTSRVVISAKKPEKKGIAIAEIFLLDENQRQIVLTREITPKENLPFFILSQNYTMIIIAAVIGVITIIGVLIVIKIKSQPPRQW